MSEDRVFRIIKREKRRLPVKLNDAEFKAAAKRAAKIADEIAAVDGEIEGYASSIKGLKARKETLNVEREAQSRIVRDEAEDRDVDVVIEVEERTKTVYERRADTNEILRERGLTQEEAQMDMWTTGDAPPAEPEKEEPKDVTPKALPEPKKKGKKKKAKDVTIEDLDAPEEEDGDDDAE